ncbi:hypothetical protein BD770DRAFT_439258 [Pilaira anomala]|nr:hypothetical protein BD770DRAFT_439258 [Pilaira anomala]
MLPTIIYKLTAVLLMAATVLATTPEADREQPTKLLGGILRKPEGCKYKIEGNSEVLLHYRARVWGEERYFEDTYTEGAPVKYKLGRDKVMKGLEKGISGMCTGEVRRLLIPADLAYGELGLPNLVPGNTAVIYEVEAIEINSPFNNPWFWAGGVAIALVFIFSNRFQNYMENSKSANFLKKKAEEKKSE